MTTIAQTIPVADSWGMHGDIGAGWWIVMVTMMVLFMGAMMWMMMRGMSGGSLHDTPPSSDRFVTRESPVEILERRFAHGDISIEEYRARREALINGSGESSADHDEEPTAPRAGGG